MSAEARDPPRDHAPADPAREVTLGGGLLVPLRRGAPLVPVDSAASRALVAVVAILAFLAALCVCAAEIVAGASAQWQASVARELTVQVRPAAQRDLEADVARAAELARATPGIAEVRVLSKEESERLLEPWLGAGLDLGELPVPRLVAVRLAEGARRDFGELRRRLAAEVPGATLDDHGQWLARLSTMASTVVVVGLALVLLVLVATSLAVAFATRGAMAGNRQIVDVLHIVGADDAFIAREFQRRFFRLGLKGGVFGGGAALAAVLAAGLLAGTGRTGAAQEQIEALFGAFELGPRGYASVAVMAAIVSVLTGAVSRLTVRRFLRETRPAHR